MNILLTGKNGQVGFELQRSLSVLGNVHAIDASDCNLEDPNALRQVVQHVQPQIIVNAAAYTAVDKAETDTLVAQAVNATAPGVLAQEAERLGALCVHFSTDYVFDGTHTGAYTEHDTPNPLNVYGATKLAGEQAVQTACQRHIILRTSWVVGAHGNNFAKTMLRLAAERETLSIVDDQFGAPTSAALLADITAHIVHQAVRQPAASFPFGLYHATAGGRTNWHEYACHVINRAKQAGYPLKVTPDAITPIPASHYPTPATRPANSMLSTEKLCATFGLFMPDWRNGVDHILDQIL